MKRPLKFRQPIFNSDGTFNDWHYWGVGIEQGGEIANAGWLSFKLDITNPDQSQAFTGVYDLSGKEIYEGDIVRRHYRDRNDSQGVVEFELQAGQYWIKWTFMKQHRYVPLCEGGMTGSDIIQLDSVEVIGNVIENKNLL